MHTYDDPPNDDRKADDPLAVDHHNAAKMISVSERKLAELVADGLIRRARAGNKNLFPVSELKRFLRDELV